MSGEDLILVIVVLYVGYGICFALMAYLNDKFN